MNNSRLPGQPHPNGVEARPTHREPASRFTPGPWRCELDEDSGDWDISYDLALHYGARRLGIVFDYTRDSEDVDGTNRANARLIAAAPELYEALAEALPWLEKRPHTAPLRKRAEAVLAKVRGEQ
jgi:hypothetical protein